MTSTRVAVSVEQTVRDYGEAWNEADEGERRRLLESAWAERGTYTDPTVHVEGRDALLEHIRGYRGRWPGARIEFASGVDAHHGMLRFAWRLLAADGSTPLEGIDFGELDSDGRLRRIVGFFGPLPRAK